MNNYISRLNSYISRLGSIRLFDTDTTLSDLWVPFQLVLFLIFIGRTFILSYTGVIVFIPYEKYQYLFFLPCFFLFIRSSYVTYTYLSHFNRSHFKTKISDLNAISRTNRILRRQYIIQYTISLKLELQKHKNLIFAVWFLVLSGYIITFIFAITGAIEDTFGLVEDVSMTSYLTGISIEHINILLGSTAFFMFVMWFISGMGFAFGDVFPSMRRLGIIFFWIGILIFLFAFAIAFII